MTDSSSELETAIQAEQERRAEEAAAARGRQATLQSEAARERDALTAFLSEMQTLGNPGQVDLEFDGKSHRRPGWEAKLRFSVLRFSVDGDLAYAHIDSERPWSSPAFLPAREPIGTPATDLSRPPTRDVITALASVLADARSGRLGLSQAARQQALTSQEARRRDDVRAAEKFRRRAHTKLGAFVVVAVVFAIGAASLGCPPALAIAVAAVAIAWYLLTQYSLEKDIINKDRAAAGRRF